MACISKLKEQESFEDILNEAGYDVNWTFIKNDEMDLKYSLNKRSK